MPLQEPLPLRPTPESSREAKWGRDCDRRNGRDSFDENDIFSRLSFM